MGLKIVYKNDHPPYGVVYDYHDDKFAMVAKKGSLFVQQLTNLGLHPVTLDPFVLGEGFYISTYTPWGGKPRTKSFFYVDDQGDVLEFETRAQLQRAVANLEDRDPSWHHEGKWLRSDGQEPVRRKIARDPLTRFDRINMDIVPDLKAPPVPKPPKTKPTDDDFMQALNEAAKAGEAKEAATKDFDGFVDDFLKNL